MKFKIGNDSNVKVVNLIENDKQLEENNLLKSLVEKEVFTNKKSKIYVDYQPDQATTIYLGLGSLDKLSADDIRKAYHKVGKTLMQY